MKVQHASISLLIFWSGMAVLVFSSKCHELCWVVLICYGKVPLVGTGAGLGKENGISSTGV